METNRSCVKHYVLQTPDSTSKNPSTVATMDSIEDWVSSFIKRSWNDRDTTSGFTEIKRNFSSKITHAGLIHYLHLCWAQEKGCELRPDMLYYTVISEIASEILANPERYVHLFSDSQTKPTIVVLVDDENIVKADRLVEAMRDVVNSPEFLSTICDVKFDSDVPDASYARKMVFACMGTPFYDYMGTRCGIPHVDIVGSLEDWKTLESAVNKLSTFLTKSKQCTAYLKTVHDIITNIIIYTFDEVLVAVSDDFTKMGSSVDDFFNDIFHYGRNTHCGSGHPDNVVKGWAKLLYFSGSRKETELSNLPSHVNYVPFTLDFSEKTFCQAVTLAYSDLDESSNTLRPGYGIITYEITNEDTFTKLANPSRTDQHGYTYTPLPLKKLKEIVDKGECYDPAYNHYGRVTRVMCDRCRNYITVCIGYGKNHDLCLPCGEIVEAEWKRLYGHTQI